MLSLHLSHSFQGLPSVFPAVELSTSTGTANIMALGALVHIYMRSANPGHRAVLRGCCAGRSTGSTLAKHCAWVRLHSDESICYDSHAIISCSMVPCERQSADVVMSSDLSGGVADPTEPLLRFRSDAA